MINKEREIINIVNRVRQRFKINVPVNFGEFVKMGKCEIKYEYNPLWDGYVEFSNDPPVIYISSATENENRQNFTLAHELGHIFIPWHDDVTSCAPENFMSEHNRLLDIQEYEANFFASELLMPTEWLRDILKKNNYIAIREIIRYVSKQSKSSIMATFFGMKRAFYSGMVMIVRSEFWESPMTFIGDNTFSNYIKGKSIEDTCKEICIHHENSSINSYELDYYILRNEPDENEILNLYYNTSDIEQFLIQITKNQIINYLHLLDYIIQCIPDYYCFIVFENNLPVIRVKKQHTLILVPFGISLTETIDYLYIRDVEYENIFITNDYTLLSIQEPQYLRPQKDDKLIDSKLLLKSIMNDLYDYDNAKRMLHRINGKIGFINGICRDLDEHELYSKFRVGIENDNDYEKFVKHKDYELFLSLKVEEIASKRYSD